MSWFFRGIWREKAHDSFGHRHQLAFIHCFSIQPTRSAESGVLLEHETTHGVHPIAAARRDGQAGPFASRGPTNVFLTIDLLHPPLHATRPAAGPARDRRVRWLSVVAR